MDCVGKLYDSILCNRLTLWFKPHREQAGAQQGRGCAEHIITLRLMMDYARCKRKKLFLLFVDFSKAYDRVPRDRLIRRLITLGCGVMMATMVMKMYGVTKLILGAAIVATSIGVRQGAPTSCVLFTLYVDELISMLKSRCRPDGYLQWLHCLLMMDDTVLLATERDRCIEKFGVLVDYCRRSGMYINESKTKFMVVNGDDSDRVTVSEYGFDIKHCTTYVYLGAYITEDSCLRSALKLHAHTKRCHVLKFAAFLNRNVDFPFWVKK